MFGEFWRAFRRKKAVFVQGTLCSISKLLCRAVYDRPFISKIIKLHCSALFVLRYFIQVLLSGVSSALQELFTRPLCLVRIELKLRRFRKPTFMVLKSSAFICCKYVTSIHEHLISSRKPVFIGLNYRCRLHLKLKELLYSQKHWHWIRVLLYCCLLLAASMGTTVKDRLSQQFWQSQGCFTCGRAILEYVAFDVLLKCVLLSNIKGLCWTLQVVEWGDVLVYTNDVPQCLHPITYKARYVQRRRVMRFMHFLITFLHHKESYSFFSISC